MNEQFKESIYIACYPYGALVENAIYYFCYSKQSGYKIRGFDPDDLAQELLIKTVRAIPGYDPKRKFMPYINTVLKRQLIQMWRKQSRSKDMYDLLDFYPPIDDDGVLLYE